MLKKSTRYADRRCVHAYKCIILTQNLQEEFLALDTFADNLTGAMMYVGVVLGVQFSFRCLYQFGDKWSYRFPSGMLIRIIYEATDLSEAVWSARLIVTSC